MLRFQIVLVLLLPVLFISAQVYHPIPDNGEVGSDLATIWVNPAILKPSVFFNTNEIEQQVERKWWRKAMSNPTLDVEPIMQVPNSSPPATPIDITENVSLLTKEFNFGERIPAPQPLWTPREITIPD